MKLKNILICVLWAGASLAHASIDVQAQLRNSLKVDRYKLDNGMLVLLHEDHSIPVVSVQQWFRVGSSTEKPGRTGLAHFFEHLMFKGTKRFSADAYERLIHANGGSNNAFTTRDYTGYYTNILSDKLGMILEVEADRMRNLELDDASIQKEREVVKEERRMRYENSVGGSLYELLYQTVYKTSNYRWPVIGYMKDLNATELSEFKEFYNTYYAPNNSILVVAGDFKTQEAKKLIEKYYGSIPAQAVPKVESPDEPEQKAPRNAVLKKDVQNITYSLAYVGPKAGDQDVFAMNILASILAGDASSRLYKKLVRGAEEVSNVDVDHDANLLSGLFEFSVSVRPGKSLDKSLKIIEDEILKLQLEPVSVAELTKVKNSVMLSYTNRLKTIAGKARWLAMREALNLGYESIFTDLDNYQKVTAEDIQRVAQKYLLKERQNLIKVVPQSTKL
jgi:zinc protease